MRPSALLLLAPLLAPLLVGATAGPNPGDPLSHHDQHGPQSKSSFVPTGTTYLNQLSGGTQVRAAAHAFACCRPPLLPPPLLASLLLPPAPAPAPALLLLPPAPAFLLLPLRRGCCA